MSSNLNHSAERDLNKLESRRANIVSDYQELHACVKHYDYEGVQKLSKKFSQEVMIYLNDVRHVKSRLNGYKADVEVLQQVEANSEFLELLKVYLDDLKSLSKSYKKNEHFQHSSELSRIMENEDARIIELEQALHSVVDLVWSA